MKRVLPLTYIMPLFVNDETLRRHILRTAASDGVKHLVLSEAVISKVVAEPLFERVIQQEMTAEGLDWVDSHAPFGPAIDMNIPDLHKSSALRHKLHINIAAAMGVDTITIHIGNDHTCIGDSCEVQIDRISQMLDELLPEAERKKVVICIENIWTRINIPENLWKIKKRFDTPYLGFCYDAGHANLMSYARNLEGGSARDLWSKFAGCEPQWDDEILEKLLPELVNCHLHDNSGLLDEHNLPGAGTVNWEKCAALLKQAPRLRSIQSEVSITRSKISVKKLVEKFEELFNN